MAEQKKDAAPVPASGTQYTVDHAPKLPSQNVEVTRDEPMIDTRLVELRDAEAKAQADRLKG